MTRRIALIVLCCLAAVFFSPVAPAAAGVPSLTGPQFVSRGATVQLSGTVQPGQDVGIWFHKLGEPSDYYSKRRSLVADSAGQFSTSYVADTDYRYYAESADGSSPVVLTQLITTTLAGPGNANRGATVTVTGHTQPPGSSVQLWFHKSGEPAGYYSLRRNLVSNSAGGFSTTYVEDTDYRYYAVANSVSSATVLTRVSPAWLQAINGYRSAYGIAAVFQNDALSAADAKHVYYMDHTGDLAHSEDPASRYYSAAGDRAAGASNIAGGWGAPAGGDLGWVNMWMNGPFHELGMLRPTLATVGFASGSGPQGQFAAVDVLSDVSAPNPGNWPKSFPSAAKPFPFFSYSGGEIPDPLSGCPAAFQNTTVSAPLLVSWGPAAAAIGSATASFTNVRGARLPVCVLTESTYRTADPNWQAVARSILAENHSVVVFVGSALSHQSAYTLTVTPNGRPAVSTHFTTAG